MRALVVALLLAACAYERPARYNPDAGPATCAVDNGGCDINATCAMAGQMSVCACKSGFAGDGTVCAPIWEHLYSIPDVELNAGAGYVAATVGSKIYFAPEFGATGKYFKSLDVMTGAIADLQMPPLHNGVDNEFCACGANESLVTQGTSIYAFGNAAAVYNTTNDTWTAIQVALYPSVRSDTVGVEARGRAYVLGGDPNRATAQYWANGFVSVTSMPFSDNTPGAVAIGDTIYVFGGGTARTEVASFDATVDTNPWVPRTSAPFDLFLKPTIGTFGAKLVMTSGAVGTLYTYDPGTDTWPGTFVLPAGDHWNLFTVNGSVYALGQKSASAIPTVLLYKLAAIP